jgi:hypothetical protein
MAARVGSSHADRDSRRAILAPARARCASWTGRAATSRSTDSSLPTFVTAGTRRTRVSEMRVLVRAGRAPSAATPTGPAPTIRTPERTRDGGPHAQHRWSG